MPLAQLAAAELPGQLGTAEPAAAGHQHSAARAEAVEADDRLAAHD